MINLKPRIPTISRELYDCLGMQGATYIPIRKLCTTLEAQPSTQHSHSIPHNFASALTSNFSKPCLVRSSIPVFPTRIVSLSTKTCV